MKMLNSVKVCLIQGKGAYFKEKVLCYLDKFYQIL